MGTAVTSPYNDRLRWARKVCRDRRARRREGVWVAEGLRLCEEVARGRGPVRLWVIEQGWGSEGREAQLREEIERRGDPVLELRRGLLNEIAGTRTPQGVLCLLEAPGWDLSEVFRSDRPVVVLDRVQDPGNLGTIARAAEGAGVSGLLLTPGTADPGNPKALRASAGSLLRLPAVVAVDPASTLRERGLTLVATAGKGGVAYERADLAGAFALLLGQEGGGVSDALARAADLQVTIPMSGGLESLNVAAAAAVILFEAARQRRAFERG